MKTYRIVFEGKLSYHLNAKSMKEAIDMAEAREPGRLMIETIELPPAKRFKYEHPREPQVDTDEENHLSSGWSGRPQPEVPYEPTKPHRR